MVRQRAKLSQALLGMLLLLSFTGVVLAAPAAAAPPSTGASISPQGPGVPLITQGLPSALTFTAIRSTSPATGLAAAQNIITCNAQQMYPHASYHVPDTVDALFRETCSAPMANIAIDMYLYDETAGALYGPQPSTSYGTANKNGTAVAPCPTPTADVWDAFTSITNTFPPGYEPNPQFAEVQSPYIFIQC